MSVKWFVPIEATDGAGDRVTTGNRTELLRDAEEACATWRHEATRLGAGDSIVVAAWRLQLMALDGRGGTHGVRSEFARLRDRGVETHLRVSSHALGLSSLAGCIALRGVASVERDRTMPLRASNHEKFSVFVAHGGATAIVGSGDFAQMYWDRTAHEPTDPRRYKRSSPAHEVAVLVDGPAARQLHDVFRRRPPATAPASPGGSAVQILRTVPTWATDEAPDDSIWRAWQNAVRSATRYVYIEDQYFWPEFGMAGDPLALLGDALMRGVDVIIVLPLPHRPRQHALRFAKRHEAIAHLRRVAEVAEGRLRVLYVASGETSVHIHSKVLLCDDEFAIIGTANVNRRSMFLDREIALGISDRSFVTRARNQLWREFVDGVDVTDAALVCPSLPVGRFREYPRVMPTRAFGALGNAFVWDHLVDPGERR